MFLGLLQRSGSSTNGATKAYDGFLGKNPAERSLTSIQTHQMGRQTSLLKHAYELLPPNNNNVVLVHYMGKERAAVPFQHGHATGLGRAYVRTCSSVLRSTKNECSQTTSATVYRKLVTVVPPATHMSVKQPQNTEQAKNITSRLLEKQRLSHDVLYNLHELATEVSDFV